MKFKRSYSNARNLRSAYKFAFGSDINRAHLYSSHFELKQIFYEYHPLNSLPLILLMGHKWLQKALLDAWRYGGHIRGNIVQHCDTYDITNTTADS